ncbi:MAG: FkbM family methyltransferase [Bacteroidetes bacterium]|nr:FkbM family methyltransferase [Bacteroidota bacterium]
MKELVYKIIDLFTLGTGLKKKFNGFPVKIPTRFINYFPSDYEKENYAFLKAQTKQGGVVLDIGAHIGLFSVISSQITGDTGKVFAFEPSPTTTEMLQKTIRINHKGNVIEPVQQAMSNEVGKITFYVSEDKIDNSNSLVEYLDDRKLKGIEVDMNTIDNFVAQKKLTAVNFIKIDVEGAEYDTLRGGTNTFLNLKPACILAIHPTPIKAKGDKLEDIYDYILKLNYSISYNDAPISKDAFCANTELIDLHIVPA